MIPTDFITAWRNTAPWPSAEQVEQDLVISRAIVEMFRVEEIASRLAWRGGTALSKLYLRPAPRYSEDIDFESEGPPTVRLRLKIEINTREHFTALGYVKHPFSVESEWFQGRAEVTTFALDELLGTKLRALYQRKKGRDLFDLWTALSSSAVNPDRMVSCFHQYMREEGHSVSRAQFEENLESKRIDPRFVEDIAPLLSAKINWNLDVAMDVLRELISKLPGEPRKTSKPDKMES